MGNCIGKIYPFDDCDSCQEHCCDICSKKLLMMGSALSKYEKRLDDEEAAREDADTKLQENLDAEINRATEAETQLRNDLNDEIDRATTKENELNTAINKEIADREAAIAELEETTNSNLEEAKQELQTNIDNEVTRAKAAEETLQSNIDKEVQDRIADVNAEETRATEAEKVLQSNIDAEEARATQAEQLLTTNLNSEIARAKAAEEKLTADLDTEIQNRTEADNELQTNIDTEVNRAKVVEQTLRNDLNTETSNRQSADNTLQTNINNEKNARIEADSDLSQRIENLEGKTTRLFYGTGTLSSPTATEIQSFIDGLDVEPPYTPPYSGIAVVVYLTDEKTVHIWHYYTNLAVWKDDGIDTVTTFTNTTKGIIQGSTNEGYISADNGLGKVNGFSELKTQVGNNYDTLNTKIEEETTRATEAEETLQANIDAEEERATQAETTLTTNLNKEIQDRTNADEALKTNIENGTIVANKATNDSDGSPISSTYVKVEGFKTNYLDSNNVAYKNDLDNIAKTNESNTFTQIQTFPAEGINVGSVHLTEAGLQTLETESEKIANKVDKTTTVNGHPLSTNVTITKADVGLGNVVNTGDSATPVNGGTTKFTTGGAYTLQQTLQNYTDSAINTVKSESYQVVSVLPQTGENGIMYLVPISGSENNYRKYIWENNKFISLGTTSLLTINLDGDLSELTLNLLSMKKFDLWINNAGSATERNKIFNSIDTITNLPAPAIIHADISALNKIDIVGTPNFTDNSWGYTAYFVGYINAAYMLEVGIDVYINKNNDTVNLHATGQARTETTLETINNALESGITAAKVSTYDGYSTSKQDKLTAGEGISITDNTISCTVSSPVTATDVVIDLK